MNSYSSFSTTFWQRAHARALLSGSSEYPDIFGDVRFYQTASGVYVIASVNGLPTSQGEQSSPIFAFHIHNGDSCGGTGDEPFSQSGTHFNPDQRPHPYHAGDMPPLFGASGYAFLAFFTNRFTVKDIIGKTVIVHSSVDDFTAQPSGNAGTKIACGKIESQSWF